MVAVIDSKPKPKKNSQWKMTYLLYAHACYTHTLNSVSNIHSVSRLARTKLQLNDITPMQQK